MPQTGELEYESSVSSGKAKNNMGAGWGGGEREREKGRGGKKGKDDVAQLGNDELGI